MQKMAIANALSSHYDSADATGIIPPRLGVAAITVGAETAAGMVFVPVIQIPAWEEFEEDSLSEPDSMNFLEPMDDLMDLDSVHNPLLAEHWRDDVNEDLISNS
jgi:hypothetical protein